MGSRIKEDERNERTIRNLLKLPANRKCINCNSLGPQYVCTNFWTFVCTTCSGIHREFTHRVKSVSMAKFTSQEVASLQNGGNERAKSIYFKDWDTQRHSFPNNSNIERLRDFIRHVYIDRRFSGERGSERPPRGEDSYENRTDAFRSGSRSPPFEDSYDHRRNDRPSPGGRSDDSYSKYGDRSPGHDRERRYPSDHGRSPNRPVIVNDWRREDRVSNASKADDRRTSDGDSWSDGRSPDHLKDTNMASPVVRPLSDILGDKVIPLKIGPPKPNGIMSAETPVHAVRSASSNSFGSSEGNQVEPKNTTLGSLIDFDTEFQPPAVTASKPLVEQSNSLLTAAKPTSATSNDNWASFDFATEAKLPQVESTVSNSMDSLLMQLTTPSSVPAQSGSFLAPGGGSKPDLLVGPAHVPPFNAEGFSSAPNSTSVAFDSKDLPGSWPGMQYQQQPNPLSSGGQISQSIQPPSNYPAAHLISKTSHGVTSGFETQIDKTETNTSQRNALPEDLFASTYHPTPSASHGWPTSHHTGMGFAVLYSVPVRSHNYQQPSKSSNPFDFGNESSLSFSSMAPLHSALPTMPNPSPILMHTPNANAPSSVYMQPPVSSYTSQIPTSYAAGMVSGAHLGQQGVVGVGDSRANQVMGGGFPSPAAPNSFPGGNPFG